MRIIKMKKIFILTCAMLTLVMSSCSDSWLNVYPATSLTSGNAIESFVDVENLLVGAYDGLQGNSGSVAYYGAAFIHYGDVRGEDMQARAPGMRCSPNYEMSYTALNVPGMWSKGYDVIKRSNNVLEAIADGFAADGAAADVNDVKGQALVIRALAHFDLVRQYGKPYTMPGAPSSFGVPIMNEPHEAGYLPSRNTVEEVYAAVIADITTAIPLLKTARSNGYINQWAAKALLARVYLYKGDFNNAYTTAVDVITNATAYSLWNATEYVAAWATPYGKEMLFELVSLSNDDWVDRESIGYLMGESGYADIILTKDFLDLILAPENDGDVRRGMMENPTLATMTGEAFWGHPVFLNKKYPGQVNGDNRLNNVPVLRLSEIYLIAAEAALLKSSSDQAAANSYLNAVVSRRNPGKPAVTATLTSILTERRMELVGEGHRFFDAMRNNLTITRTSGWQLPLIQDSRSFTRDYYRTILAIPSGEINANPNISGQQNPGY